MSAESERPLGLVSTEGLGRTSAVPALHAEAFADASRMVKAFGCKGEQAAAAFISFSIEARKLDDEQTALIAAVRAKRPWYRRGRW